MLNVIKHEPNPMEIAKAAVSRYRSLVRVVDVEDLWQDAALAAFEASTSFKSRQLSGNIECFMFKAAFNAIGKHRCKASRVAKYESLNGGDSSSNNKVKSWRETPQEGVERRLDEAQAKARFYVALAERAPRAYLPVAQEVLEQDTASKRRALKAALGGKRYSTALVQAVADVTSSDFSTVRKTLDSLARWARNAAIR